MYGLSLYAAAATEPVTLAEAKLHLRVDHTDEDALIENLIAAARDYAEKKTNRQLVTATWDLKLDRFPHEGMSFPKAPLQSVSSIIYTAADGTSTTWASSNYVVSTGREPGIVTPAYGVAWPTARNKADAVVVRFVAGYGAAAAVPGGIKAAMLLLIGHWYANREEVVIGTITSQVPVAADRLLEMYSFGDEFTCYGPADSQAA